jgi:hypothetical protein
MSKDLRNEGYLVQVAEMPYSENLASYFVKAQT